MRVLLLHMSRIDGLTKINTVSSRLGGIRTHSSNLITLYYYLVLMKSIRICVSTGYTLLYVTDTVAKSSVYR